MTTPPPPIGQFLRPLRDLAVYALAGVPAVLLFAAVLDLFGSNFLSRTQDSFSSFVNIATIFFPIAAVVLSLGVAPVHPKARTITMIALVEYGVAAFFGLVFGVLFGVSNIASTTPGSAFLELLVRVAWLAMFGLGAYAVWQIWRGLFAVPKPRPQAGVYGQPFGQQPGYGPQGPYAQQPPYGPPPGFSGPPAGYGPPPGFAGPPPGYGPPPVWNQPPVATAPVSTPPASGAVYPGAPAPFTDPTQVVPRPGDVPSDRPGFGPADQDRPRQ